MKTKLQTGPTGPFVKVKKLDRSSVLDSPMGSSITILSHMQIFHALSAIVNMHGTPKKHERKSH